MTIGGGDVCVGGWGPPSSTLCFKLNRHPLPRGLKHKKIAFYRSLCAAEQARVLVGHRLGLGSG